MTPILQIIVVAFALFAWSRAILRFKNSQIGFPEFIMWSVLWVGAGAVVLRPQWTEPFANFLGIGRPIDVGIYASIILLYYLIFKVYVKIENVEREITQLVRDHAIDQSSFHRKKSRLNNEKKTIKK